MRILVFGDSVTQGFHDDQYGGWCNRLAQYAIKKTVESDFGYDTCVFNLGISGNNTDNLVKRFPGEIRARLGEHEGAVVFALGINDSQYELASNESKVPIDRYKTNLTTCITEAKKYTDHIYVNSLLPINDDLLTPMPWKPTHGYKTEFVNLYNETVKQIASEMGVKFIDVSDVLPNISTDFLPDGIHPNARGHELIYKQVKAALEAEGIL